MPILRKTPSGALSAALAAVAVLALAGCSSEPIQKLPTLSFVDEAPIKLDVAEVQVKEAYTPPLELPNVEHLMPLSPSQAVRTWAHERLRAVGSHGTAEVIIEQASVKQIPLEKSGGLTGLVTTDQEARYDLLLQVRLNLQTANGLSTGYAETTVKRSRTVPENMTLNERDEKLYYLVADSTKDLDEGMDQSIHTHLGDFVR
ncbi:MAG TPA: hypothetical protein VE631_06475 [Alphaproteobacteria bacterium]|jgi:hypothetical protein|nr:hypothetical protein [Alphaproteobacteria bacterium]